MIEIKQFGIPTLHQRSVIFFFHNHRLYKVCDYKGQYSYPVVLSRSGAINCSRAHWSEPDRDYAATLNEFKRLRPDGRIVQFDEDDQDGMHQLFSDFLQNVPLVEIRAGDITPTELPLTPGEYYLASEECLLRMDHYVSLVAIRSALDYTLEPFKPDRKSAYIQKFLGSGGKRRVFFFEPAERQGINQLITNFCNSVPVEAL